MDALAGRTVLVTGAAGTLGRVAVSRVVDSGGQVVLVGRDAERLATVADRHPGAVAAAHAVDLTDAAAVSRLAAEVGPDVDAVWHLVGGWRGGAPLPQQPLEDWDWLHDQLVRTTVHVARSFADHLAGRPSGRFALVSSPMAVAPTSSNAGYAAAKAGAEAVTLALADHLRGSTATANVVVVPSIGAAGPGAVRPEDVAFALVYLTSEAAGKMNGQRIRLYSGGPA